MDLVVDVLRRIMGDVYVDGCYYFGQASSKPIKGTSRCSGSPKRSRFCLRGDYHPKKTGEKKGKQMLILICGETMESSFTFFARRYL